MSIITAIKHTISENIRSETGYPEDVRADAKRLARETSLTQAEAYVVAGDNADLDDAAIDRAIVYSGKSVRDVRRQLHEKKLDLQAELSQQQRAVSALGDWQS